MTKWAEPEVVAAAIEEWSDGQIACRTNGHHAWPTWKGTLVSHRPGFYTLRQRCTRRCGAAREGDMNEQGYMVSKWRPWYPKDSKYVLPPGSGRLGQDGRAMIRLAGLRSAQVIEVNDE